MCIRDSDNHYDQSRHEDNYPHDGNYRIAEHNTEDRTETVQNQHSNPVSYTHLDVYKRQILSVISVSHTTLHTYQFINLFSRFKIYTVVNQILLVINSSWNDYRD